MHAPFVYDLFTKSIQPSRKQAGNPIIEGLRKELYSSKMELHVQDYGAGRNKNPQRKVKTIAKNSVSSHKKSNLIDAIGMFYQAKNILELGTSLGINTLYLSQSPERNIVTFEGSESISKLAIQHFERLERRNIKLVLGNIDTTLPNYLAEHEPFDLAYIDANHRYEPTLSYYQQLLKKSHKNSIIIFDDIHYSRGMEQAWNEIIKKKEITLSIDLFHIGMVAFDPSLHKKHYIL